MLVHFLFVLISCVPTVFSFNSLLLQANIQEYEEKSSQQQDMMAKLSAQNASLQQKCNIFKSNVKGLNEKNQAWEDSYKAQSNDLVQHGMEISRLNGRVSDLKSQLIRVGRSTNRIDLASAQTTPAGRNILKAPNNEARGRYTF